MEGDDPFAGTFPPQRPAEERSAPAEGAEMPPGPPEWARPDPFWLDRIGVGPAEYVELIRRYEASGRTGDTGDFRRFVLDQVRARNGGEAAGGDSDGRGGDD